MYETAGHGSAKQANIFVSWEPKNRLYVKVGGLHCHRHCTPHELSLLDLQTLRSHVVGPVGAGSNLFETVVIFNLFRVMSVLWTLLCRTQASSVRVYRVYPGLTRVTPHPG